MESNKTQEMATINVDDEAFVYAIEVCNYHIFSMVFHAAIELNLFEIIGKSGHVSASHIASRLPMHGDKEEAPTTVDRMLHLLASYSLLTCSLNTLEDGNVERLYGLSPAGKFFVKDADGVSLASVPRLTGHPAITNIRYHLKDAVLGGDIPFEKSHGISLFEYMKNDPKFRNVFHDGMSSLSTIGMRNALRVYKGFEGLKSLVDVGGGSGTTLNMIVSSHPSIVGINFDLPPTLTNAPSYPGIKHVSGDMFEGVPKGEAILLKWILHNWNDEQCLKILKKCHAALPETGKVIVIDTVLPVAPETTLIGKDLSIRDNMMFAYFGAKERREKEFNALAKEAGFSSFQVVCCTDGNSIMELHK